MLVLTRRTSESLIMSDGDIVITVLGIKGNQVRIGIQAPENTQVDREELYLRKQRDNKMKAMHNKNKIVCGSVRKILSELPIVRG